MGPHTVESSCYILCIGTTLEISHKEYFIEKPNGGYCISYCTHKCSCSQNMQTKHSQVALTAQNFQKHKQRLYNIASRSSTGVFVAVPHPWFVRSEWDMWNGWDWRGLSSGQWLERESGMCWTLWPSLLPPGHRDTLWNEQRVGYN